MKPLLNRNLDIKKARGNIPYWFIAEKLNVAESTIYRKLRRELSPEEKEAFLNAIQAAKQELTSIK